MKTRVDSIDLLRGLAIVGMVLSGQMFRHSDLPAWLFHAQVPPPDFRFDPAVPGITWVDLVFPFFLFSMGAAFPLALHRKLEQKGESIASVAAGIVQRWALLVLFAISLANLSPDTLHTLPAWAAAAMQLVAWCCFGLLFLRKKGLTKTRNRLMHAGGLAGLTLLLCGARWAGGAQVSLYNSDIIILILANMALFGSLIWLCTRRNPKLRLAILALLVAIRLGAQAEGSWNQTLWNWTPAAWLFRFEYLQYLCIVLPGTIVGEWFRQRTTQQAASGPVPQPGRETLAATLAMLLIVVNLWGLFTRYLAADLAASILLGAALHALVRRDGSPTGRLHRRLTDWGVGWLLLGLALEAFEGGIKKDPVTLSYLFVTSGLASVALVWASTLMRSRNVRFGALVKCGRNPLVAYTAAGFLLTPLLVLTHAYGWFERISGLNPWTGAARGLIMTAAVMGITILCTDKRLFWRT